MQRFHPHEEPWGEYVEVKINAVEALSRQLNRRTPLPPGDVFVSSACDGWQPEEEKYRLTRECCRLLLAHQFSIFALTKSELIRRDFDVFAGGNVQVGVTIATLDPEQARLWEPRASGIDARYRVLAEAKAAGFTTHIMHGPLLPFLSDSDKAIRAMLQRDADTGIDLIRFDAMNPRPKVWESVRALLEEHYPELVDRYQAVFFWPKVRDAYIQGLHARINGEARKLHLRERVAF
jgi:DNA repair photolyase